MTFLPLLCFTAGLLSLLPTADCEKIRLVGPSRCAGRVEINYNDIWGTVCDDHWTIINAQVLCQELNCGSAMETKTNSFFGEGKNEIWLDDVQCTGKETSILKCSHSELGENNCAHSEDVGVICSDHVKITNGSSRCEGRVELYHGGHWKKVCGSDWGQMEAEVLCREINCGTPLVSSQQMQFGAALKMDNVKTNCRGNESSLVQCAIQEYRESCVDAVVACGNNKPIRLVNGTHPCSGRVELYISSQWGTVCDDRWGMNEAQVVCRELNCGIPLEVKADAFYGKGQDQVWMDDVQCSGREKYLSDCTHRTFGQHDCNHNEDAGVVCSEKIRLTNGTGRCNGRLELKHKDTWVNVCDNNWNYQMAKMLCSEIRCGKPKETGVNTRQGRVRGFVSRCPNNVTSITQCDLQQNLGMCEAASLSCEGNPSVRLSNGSGRCSGRVEIMHNAVWGTVCDDSWDINDAQVVCRSMDCGSAQTAKHGSFFGEGKGEIWLDDMQCSGNETSLEHCSRPEFGHNDCSHSEDAGVICSENIRLYNGTDQCSGRVEFYVEGQWSAVSRGSWGRNEATVVCREMNCGDVKSISDSFGRGSAIIGYTVTCTGREMALNKCSLREVIRSHMEEASVVCSGNVRLAGGPNDCAGRAEYFDKGQWGTMCGEYFDMNDATVVCKQLNCGLPHQITKMLEYGHGSGNFWIKQFSCHGQESSLAQCQQEDVPGNTCNVSSIAGLICKDSVGVRAVNQGTDYCTGRVEVRNGPRWQHVCDTEWTLSKAQSVCDVLDCGSALNAPGGTSSGSDGTTGVDASDSCFQNMTSLQDCVLHGFSAATCGAEHASSFSCAAQLRLVGGSTPCSGRVEVFHKAQWGTVCDDEWTLTSGDVVCRQLGCGHAVAAPMSAHYGEGSGPIWLDNVECGGEELALSLCVHPGYGENNCGHGEDASVICLGDLQKPEISVTPGLEVNWGAKVEFTCTLLTEQKGGTFTLKKTQDPGKEGLKRFSEHGFAVFIISKVDFSHGGSYYCEFQKKLEQHMINYPQGTPVDLVIQVNLEKPSISLTSPHTMVIFSPEKVSVNKGSSFSITCSIHTKYPDGLFYLTNLKSNLNTSDVKPSFGHSVFFLAYFEFPSIASADAGLYSCVYALNVSSRVYLSTPSKSLDVTVVESSSSPVLTSVVVGGVLLVLLLIAGYLLWRRRWRNAASTVEFSSRLGGGVKASPDDRGNGALDGRDISSQQRAAAQRQVLDDKLVEVDADGSVENAPEDLAGRVCYELEPLVQP